MTPNFDWFKNQSDEKNQHIDLDPNTANLEMNLLQKKNSINEQYYEEDDIFGVELLSNNVNKKRS